MKTEQNKLIADRACQQGSSGTVIVTERGTLTPVRLYGARAVENDEAEVFARDSYEQIEIGPTRTEPLQCLGWKRNAYHCGVC